MTKLQDVMYKCACIGNIPSTYIDSMSYEEQILWLCKFLQESILPVITENSEAIEELQNLDLQEEVNKKLEEMAESGQLQEIIDSYLVIKSQLVYNTVSDMKSATNLIDGSFAKTLGYYSTGDGGNATYKVREVTNQDTVDEMFLIALNDENLVAELIIENDTISVKQLGAVGDGSTDETSLMQKFIQANANKYIINAGTYLIDGDLVATSNSEIVFEDGAKLKRKTTSATTYFMIHINSVDNVTIRNGYIIGDRETHTGGTGEWGHGINIVHSSNINIIDTYIEQTWGDGIYIGYYSGGFTPTSTQQNKNILIQNVHTYKCSRAGIQLSSVENVEILDCHLEYTDRYSSMVGINIEAEGPDGTTPEVVNVDIKGLKTNNNTYNGIQIYLPTNKKMDQIIIDNHTSYNDLSGFAIAGTGQIADKESIIYKNSSIILCSRIPIQIKDKGLKCGLIIDNILIDSSSRTDSMDNLGIVRLQNTRASYPCGNIILSNIKFANTYGGNFWNSFIYTPNASEDVGVIQDITMNNIESINNMLCINSANSNFDITTTKHTNCRFDYVGTYATIPIARQNYSRVIRPSLLTNSNTNITQYCPDGEYEIMVYNVNGYTYTVTFADYYSVYKGDSSSTARTFTSNKSGSLIKFIKSGSSIMITNISGFSA